MEWSQGNLVWFDPGGLGHPLPGEIQEVHQAAQIIVVQAVINGKVNIQLRRIDLVLISSGWDCILITH